MQATDCANGGDADTLNGLTAAEIEAAAVETVGTEFAEKDGSNISSPTDWRTALALGSAATHAAADFDPAGAAAAALVSAEAYADAVAQGLSIKGSVAFATTAALPAVVYVNGSSGVGATLTGSALGALSIDSNAPSVGQRVLIKDQVAGAQNGIYTVTAAGSGAAVFVLTRAVDNDVAAEVPGAFTFVEAGTVNVSSGWVVGSAGPFVIGTTAIVWTQFSGAGEISTGTGLTKTGNTLAVDTTVIAPLNSPALTGTPSVPDGTAATQPLNTETADLRFEPVLVRTLQTQVGDYTLVLGDKVKTVEMNKATAITLTIPTNAGVAFAVGTKIPVRNVGAGLLTISPTGGVTLNGLATLGQFAETILEKTASDTWLAAGDGIPYSGANRDVDLNGHNFTTSGGTVAFGSSSATAFSGSGSPEASVTASRGDIYTDVTNGVLYLKTSGSATNTGWCPVAGPSVVNTQAGTTYTTVLSDQGKTITLNNGSAITFTIDTNANVAFPTGTRIKLRQLGAGQVNVVGAGGVTVNATPGAFLRAQYSEAMIEKTATNTWQLYGDISS